MPDPGRCTLIFLNEWMNECFSMHIPIDQTSSQPCNLQMRSPQSKNTHLFSGSAVSPSRNHMLSWALRLKPSSLSEAGPKALPLLTCTCLPDITVLVVNSGVIPVKTHFLLSKWYSLSLGVYLTTHCICSSIQIASIHEWMPPIENGKQSGVLSAPSISLAPNFTFQMLSFIQLTPEKINRPLSPPVLIHCESRTLRSFVLPGTAWQGRRPAYVLVLPPLLYACALKSLRNFFRAFGCQPLGFVSDMPRS